MAQPTFSELLGRLRPDPWRDGNPFGQDIQECHKALFSDHASTSERKTKLREWIGSPPQVCPFGRTAANQERLTICMLLEEDLLLGDDHVRTKIARDRTKWHMAAAKGDSFGFVISVVSKRIATSIPDASIEAIATKIIKLYIDPQQPSITIRDRVWLEVPQPPPPAYLQWFTSIGYFSAQADGRWWNDRRIPGGLAFSANAIGHMTASLLIKDTAQRGVESIRREHLVYFGLSLAMHTIKGASQIAQPGSNPTVYKPKPLHGTELVCRREEDGVPPYDPNNQRFADLKMYSENVYIGSYDTDATLPPYFFNQEAQNISKPLDFELPFSYIHSEQDEDYRRFALGKLLKEDKELFDNLSRQIMDSQ